MPILSKPSTRVFALILFSLLATSVVGAAEFAATSEQPRKSEQDSDTAGSAASLQVDSEHEQGNQAVMLPKPAPSSPIRPKGERPKLGLCDGS